MQCMKTSFNKTLVKYFCKFFFFFKLQLCRSYLFKVRIQLFGHVGNINVQSPFHTHIYWIVITYLCPIIGMCIKNLLGAPCNNLIRKHLLNNFHEKHVFCGFHKNIKHMKQVPHMYYKYPKPILYYGIRFCMALHLKDLENM